MKNEDAKTTEENTLKAECDSVQRLVVQYQFETWWNSQGAELTRINMCIDEDDTDNMTMDFVKYITKIAWSNAEECAVIF